MVEWRALCTKITEVNLSLNTVGHTDKLTSVIFV